MDLNILKDKNSHPRDSRIKFDSENHIYSIDDNNNYISVTQLISNFFPRFDKDYWANKESIKTGMPKKEIIKGWDEKGRKARESGTHMHLQIEKYYNNYYTFKVQVKVHLLMQSLPLVNSPHPHPGSQATLVPGASI